MNVDSLNINLAESFPRLTHAPIVEAVMEVRARAEAPWDEAEITRRLEAELPDYPFKRSAREFQDQVKFGLEGPSEASRRDLGWKGCWCQSQDKLHITQFNREAFTFSRVGQYDTWEQFRAEAVRLWQLHRRLAQPTEVQRLGLRFINRVEILDGARLEDFLHAFPQTPRDLDLPFSTFLHRDTFVVPGRPYAINRVQTVQHGAGPGKSAGLILDNDVYTTQPFPLEGDVLEQRLAEMRWLKNKFFFGSITRELLERLR
jgi:uncharacterized protein (TIGR04255 family)